MSWLLAIYTWLPAVMSCAFLRTSTILLKRLIRCSMRLKKSKTMLRLGEEYSGVYPYVTARYNYRTPKTKTPIQPRRGSRCRTRWARPARAQHFWRNHRPLPAAVGARQCGRTARPGRRARDVRGDLLACRDRRTDRGAYLGVGRRRA